MADMAVTTGWFTLGGAAVGATATFGAVFLREIYTRRRDRKSLAAALLAEVKLLVEAVADEKGVYESLNKLVLRDGDVTAVPPEILRQLQAAKGALDYRVSIYEKCAPQIGLLDPEIAERLVRFFYFVDEIRYEARQIFFNPEAIPEVRRDNLNRLLNTHIPQGIQEGESLRRLLEAVVNRSFWGWVRRGGNNIRLGAEWRRFKVWLGGRPHFP